MNRILLSITFAVCAAAAVLAQQPPGYGTSVTLETAERIAAPALMEARKNGWAMAVAIVDISGELVHFQRMDDTQFGSVDIAIAKARTAARFKRPTKAFEDVVAAGGVGLRTLALPGIMPAEGGIPLISGGKIVGAIGVSGGTSAQDGQCARAAADQLK